MFKDEKLRRHPSAWDKKRVMSSCVARPALRSLPPSVCSWAPCSLLSPMCFPAAHVCHRYGMLSEAGVSGSHCSDVQWGGCIDYGSLLARPSVPCVHIIGLVTVTLPGHEIFEWPH